MGACEVVEGEGVRVGERELVPVVRVTRRVERRAYVGADGVAGQGGGFVRLHPVAVVERSATGERRFAIRDRTVHTLIGLFLVALLVPLLAMVIVWIAECGMRNEE
ncbi:MAG TPA: hypothetical protein VMY80_17285 [Anaerolineae bacterium]|nr:hypothetical protein [Anaerolineae bacterium]